MRRIPATIRGLGLAALVAAFLAPSSAGLAAGTDDTSLFSTSVAPNVLLVADNSGSMEHIVWHPAFDPNNPAGDASAGTIAWKCNQFAPSGSGVWGRERISGNSSRTYCSNNRTLYHDSSLSNTRWDHRYINWYFGLDTSIPAEQTILNELAATANGTTSGCLGAGTFSKYRRSRASALQNVLREVICQVNQVGTVRFGMAQFRDEGDPEGGFVVVPIDDYSSSQDAALQTAITRLTPETWTPLGETLFQVYTYFMRRDSQRPAGATSGTLPKYGYSTSTSGEGGEPTASPPPQPVQYHCQKSFVVIITDGEPTRDDFDSDSTPGVDVGFSNFGNLIGDYYQPSPDHVEVQDDVVCTDCETALYLDDIAKFMQDTDFDPVLADDQLIDVYTVGFTTNAFANALLQQTADVGNGQFYQSNNAEELAGNIIDAITDIIQKSQAFTAATVPATRTADGGNFYTSFFIPSSKDPFWEGHIKNFTINAQGQILDSGGLCALGDPNPPSCIEGAFLPSASPHWDAADAMPAPGSRNLSMSLSGAKVDMDSTVSGTAAALGVTYPPPVTYSDSLATNAEELADEIMEYARGCEFGTGTGGVGCVQRSRPDGRPRTLGDVFHSNPIVVGPPNLLINEPSYAAFASATARSQRQRMLIAGANDGFLHAFDAGTYNTTLQEYTRGYGTEVFGFMPWWARTQFKNFPPDIGNRDYYFVDGSPIVSDAWIYPSATTAPLTDPLQKAANGSEWKTVLVSGMRQGGPTYFALDITDPSVTSGPNAYPIYMWEFPAEGSAQGFSTAGTYPYLDYMGEGWSDPVIAKVKVTTSSGAPGLVYERWVAVVASGYSTQGDPNHIDYDASNDASTSRAGRAILMIDIKTGKVLAAQFYHHDDSDSSLGSAAGGNSEMRFALASTPAVIDSDFDGFADLIYVGDLGGNVWKWVLRDPGVDTINPSEDDTKFQSNWTFGKFFQAPSATIGATTHYKSFFFPPTLVYYGKQLWMTIGSGERANPSWPGADPVDDSENNRLYVFKDPNQYGLPNSDLSGDAIVDPVVLESHLADLTTTTGCASLSTLGYYIVAREGEKFVTNIELIANLAFTGSFTPSGSGDPCDAGGSATLYAFKFFCGEGFYPANTGADQRRLELGDGVPTSPRLSVGEENRLYMMTSENELKSPPPPPIPKPGEGIFYWRELTQ
jgi:type IV pilus assembly protein PilY1